MSRQTKIVATLGPATTDEASLRGIVDAGVDMVRMNLSHGDHDEHRDREQTLRRTARAAGRVVGMLCDLQGPKIRVERFAGGSVELDEGAAFFLDPTLDGDAGSSEGVGVAYAGLPTDVAPGDILLLADGLIRLEVERIEGTRIHTRVTVGGTLGDRKGINRLGGGLSVRALTDKDRVDIKLAAELEADYMAVSFPRDGADIDEARALLREAGGHGGIVAKIERHEAVEALDEIMEAADAVMIARGDLAVEIGDAELPGVQKRIMRMARERDCVVITATQMMQSMVDSPMPTRAEVLDVANAVLDGTDAVMLSEETAMGQYPAETVGAMSRVCIGAETYADETRPSGGLKPGVHFDRIDEAIAKTAITTANSLGAKAIAALTESGATAMWMSRIGTDIPIYALSEQPRTRRKVTLYRGVNPIRFDPTQREHDAVNREAVAELKGLGAVSDDDLVVITKGDLAGEQGGTNAMKVVKVSEIVR
ncbi:pyruvate kinase [Spiribacter aquaticus]|uniref:Pyruvate kinase n=1 Tax=Spiribacter aquaticus TaxID=1935996 RepID=A0A557RN82_9GAMM|nr:MULTISPECIES: pyruvate kinase [Spiribacter]KAF0279661.1 pyruvate kinase [Spiribacter roseus]TVO66631.1 pyruvate kinase [Spiribacter aquaticus]